MSPRHRTSALKLAAWFFVLGASGAGALFAGRLAIRAEVHHSNEFCVGCHSAAPAHLGDHSDIACAECHAIPQGQETWLWFAEVRGSQAAPEHGAVEDGGCKSCHQRDADAWTDLSTSSGHATHADLVACTRCHDGSLHGQQDPDEACTSCHEAPNSEEPTAGVACTTCHNFAAAPSFIALGDQERRRPDAAPGDEPVVDASRLHGTVECGRCHDPHRPDPTGEVAADCEGCHRVDLPEQVAGGPSGHQNCRGCHDIHGPMAQPAVECIQCHRMPNGRSGTQWEISPTPVPEVERARLRASISHEAQCQRCHKPHTWVADATRCAECHEEKVNSIAQMPPESHGNCLGCHDPHRAPPTTKICANCHQDKTRAVRAARPARHRDCTSCHDPHQRKPAANRVCGSCHAAPHGQLQNQPAQHRNCVSCHNPHGNPLRGAQSACARCHREKSQALARAGRAVPRQHRCANCHVPHQFAPATNALRRCSSCHAQPSAASANHRDTCTNCHTPHQAPMGRAANCAGCHQAVRPAVRGHQQCNRCHRPHRKAEAALGQCRSCHASEVRALASWPSGSPHRGQCARCHTPHNEGRIAACSSCHQDHQNRRHMGVHRQCTGCHKPHRPRPANSDWQSRCGDCHRAQAAGVARSSGTHTRCKNCHQVPGPPLPTCAGCHENQRSRLLHSVPQHGTCSTCHEDHSNAPPTRRNCTHCHRDRQNHFPDAQTCQSCHPFRPGAPVRMRGGRAGR
ncbi:MAG: hypothetical protein GXP55_17615 [Deltaproteobacteria bacterium]|nr:hypothetical protein [Deltaproteobacteria bacterium]